MSRYRAGLPAAPGHKARLLPRGSRIRDRTARQRLSQALNAFGGNLRVAEGQQLKVGQSFEMLQPGVGDSCAEEVQALKASQATPKE